MASSLSITAPTGGYIVAREVVTLAFVREGTGLVSDFVGLYRTGKPYPVSSGFQGAHWKYLNNSQSAPGAPVASGTVTFDFRTASDVQPGQSYEWRLLEGGGTYLALARTAAVPVGFTQLAATPTAVAPSASVTWAYRDDPGFSAGNKQTFIGVHPAATLGSGTYVDWCYLDGTQVIPSGQPPRSGSCTRAMPATPGHYIGRLWTGTTLLAQSNVVAVSVGATVVPPVIGANAGLSRYLQTTRFSTTVTDVTTNVARHLAQSSTGDATATVKALLRAAGVPQ